VEDKTDRTKEKEELKNILSIEKMSPETIATSVVYDGTQYSIRIPKKFVNIMHIDSKKDKFEFTITIPKSHKELPELEGKLIKG